MNVKERVLMECRYLISLNKTCKELASMFNVSENTIYEDLNKRLYVIDKILYDRVRKLINSCNM